MILFCDDENFQKKTIKFFEKFININNHNKKDILLDQGGSIWNPYKSTKYYINPKGTLSYQLQVEEMVNNKSVWEYGSKMVWNDEENYYEGDYHPNLEGYRLIGEYIYKEIKNLI